MNSSESVRSCCHRHRSDTFAWNIEDVHFGLNAPLWKYPTQHRCCIKSPQNKAHLGLKMDPGPCPSLRLWGQHPPAKTTLVNTIPLSLVPSYFQNRSVSFSGLMSGTGTATGSWIFQPDGAIVVIKHRPLDGGGRVADFLFI